MKSQSVRNMVTNALQAYSAPQYRVTAFEFMEDNGQMHPYCEEEAEKYFMADAPCPMGFFYLSDEYKAHLK